MRYLIGFSLVLLLAGMVGCKNKTPQVSETRTVTDSTFVRETVRLVEVTVPGDSVPYQVLIECDPVTNKPKPMSFSKQGRQAGITMELDSLGMLQGVLSCLDQELAVLVKDTEIFRLRQESFQMREVVRKPVYKTRWYDTACRWIAAIALAALLIKLILKHLKFHI